MDRSIDVHAVKRYKNLLETSVDETERRTIKRLLAEEDTRQSLHASSQKAPEAVSVSILAVSGEPMSINEKAPTSNPNDRRTLTGLTCVIGFVILAVLYYKIIGF